MFADPMHVKLAEEEREIKDVKKRRMSGKVEVHVLGRDLGDELGMTVCLKIIFGQTVRVALTVHTE